MNRSSLLLAGLVLLAACSGREQGGSDAPVEQAGAPNGAVPQRMAYGYSFRFSVPEASIGTAQERHVAMCEQLGPPRCRVIETHRTTGEYGSASAKLEVASGLARRFGAGLTGPVEALGGALVSSDVEAQDIGRTIVDVEARLRAKQALVDRLNAALRTRSGTVAELVATEKAVADAQGELDAVRSELAQAQGRIATSPLDIAYERRASFAADTGQAFGAIGQTISASVVALIYFLAAAVPWIAVGVIAFLAGRRLRRRKPRDAA